MINATKVLSSARALASLDLKSLFCSKASFVRIAAAVSIAIVCLFYRIELAHEESTVSLDYTTLLEPDVGIGCHSIGARFARTKIIYGLSAMPAVGLDASSVTLWTLPSLPGIST